ncbi:hypothetical protein Nmel_006490 [Mimus melanotis]
MKRLTNWGHHFGPLLCPTLISLPKPEGLMSFFIKVQRFYTNNLD